MVTPKSESNKEIFIPFKKFLCKDSIKTLHAVYLDHPTEAPCHTGEMSQNSFREIVISGLI